MQRVSGLEKVTGGKGVTCYISITLLNWRVPRKRKLLSESELLRLASVVGRPVTSVQLASWRKRGLLPSPARRWPGRGAGSETLGYRSSTLPQVLAVSSLLRERRDLDRATWELWLAGYPVTPAVQRLLSRRAERLQLLLDTELEREEAAVDSDDPNDRSKLIKKLTLGRVSPEIAKVRGKFRGNRRQQFATVVQLLLESARGTVSERIARGELNEDELEPLCRALAGFLGLPNDTLKTHRQSFERVVRGFPSWLATEVSARVLVRELQGVDYRLLEDLRGELVVGWMIRALETQRAPFRITPNLFLVWFALRWVSLSTSSMTRPVFKTIEWDGARPILTDLFHKAKRASILAPLFSPEEPVDGHPLLDAGARS